MNDDILSAKFVLEYGTHYDDLEIENCTYRLLVPNATNIGFTGLAYEGWQEDGDEWINWYCYYINGYEEGVYISFYENDNYETAIRKINHFRFGSGDGEYKRWDNDGNLVEEDTVVLARVIKYRKYDKKGNVIEEKTGPNEDDLVYIKREVERIKKLTYSFSNSYNKIETIEWNNKQITDEEVKKLLEKYIENVKDLKNKKSLELTNPFDFRFAIIFEKSIPKNAVDKNPAIERIKNPLFKKICINYFELRYLAEDSEDKESREYFKIYDPLIEIFEKSGGFEVIDDHVKIGSEFDIDFSDF